MDAVPLTFEIISLTKAAWNEQLDSFSDDEDVMLATSYRSRLSFMAESLEGTGPGFYGLIGEEGYARSVLELTHRRGGSRSQLRLLNIHLEPKLDVENRDRGQMDVREAVFLLTRSISEALRLTFDEHPSNELKVYVRTDHVKGFLEVIASQLESGTAGIPGLSIDTEGRWLVFKKS